MTRLSLLTLCLVSAFQARAAEPPKLPEVPEDKRAWKATGELAEWLSKMQKAREASQKVFEPLTTKQMNWRPPNGTHTPRWNAEHMPGWQLLFFSQIYAKLDPARHKEINLNPAQMPPDYQAAHPERTGADEAAWMQKVGDYVQGHAYLLEGLDLDAQAPGSQWKTLRALFKRMEGHYGEHTANVVKKMKLDSWPKE